MKIARVVAELDFGGVEKVLELASLELRRRPEVHLLVVVLSRGGRTSELLLEKGLDVVILNKSCQIPNVPLLLKLYKLLKENNIDLLHSSGAEANFHGIFAGFLAGVKVRIGEEIGLPNHNYAWELLFKFIYSLSHKVIFISKAVQQFVIYKGEVTEDKSIVIYNPVKVLFLDKKVVKREGFTFITVARLVPIKNLNNLLIAFRQIKCESKSLVIIGEGESKEGLIQLSVDLGLQQQVRFLGFQEEVSQFLFQAQCFVLPSYSEGSSVALAEAMMASLPSIVTKIGGASEIIGDSSSGILINPYDQMNLTEGMEYMINLNDEERLEMGHRARAYAINNFSPATHVDQLYALYDELLYEKN